MNVTKKATKFTKLIAYQLKDLYNENYDKEELKSSFQGAVKDLTKKEIKSEIQENIDKYVKKLQKYLNVHDGQPNKKTTFPCNLYIQGGCDLTDTVDLSKKDKQLLVSHVVSEHVDYTPDLLSRLDDFTTESDVFPELSSCHKLLRITVGNRHGETLQQILFKYFNAVQPLAEKMLTDNEHKRCGELAKEIKGFICVCHLRKKDCFETTDIQKKSTPVYEDILASLLSVYVELFILSLRLEDKKLKKARQLCGFVMYVLPWQHQQLDLLLQLSVITEDDAELVIPLSRSILKWNSENKDEKYYLKYVLAVRAIRNKVSDPTEDIFQSTQTIPAANGFMSWLLEQDNELCDEFPNDKGFKTTTITKFLLEEAADDQVDRLLDIFTCNQSEGNQLLPDQSASGKQQNKTVLEELSFFIDPGENKTEEEIGGIFFIDKIGLGSKREKNEDKLSKEIDTVVKHTEESDVMETEVFVVDTEHYKNLDRYSNESKMSEEISDDEETRSVNRKSCKSTDQVNEMKYLDNEKDVLCTDQVRKNLFKFVENKVDGEQSLRTRKNSHKCDENEQINISQEISLGKSTRKSSVKSDEMKFVENKKNELQGKRTRRNSHKSDGSNKIGVDQEKSIGKRTRQNSCTVDASEMTTDDIAVKKKKRTTSETSEVEENRDSVVNTSCQATRRSKRVSECSVQHDEEENKIENEIDEDQNLRTGKSDQTDVSILRAVDREIENSGKIVKHKIDEKGKKTKAETRKIPQKDITHFFKPVNTKTMEKKVRVSKMKQNKGKISFNVEMASKSDACLNSFSRDTIATEGLETNGGGTVSQTRSGRTYSNKSDVISTNQTETSVGEELADRQGREFEVNTLSTIDTLDSPLKVETMEQSRKNSRRCLEFYFQRVENSIKPSNMSNEKIDMEIGRIKDLTDSEKESIYIDTEVSDSQDEDEDVSIMPVIIKHLKLHSKQRITGENEMGQQLPWLPALSMNNDGIEANKIYKFDECPKLFENKSNLNSSDTEDNLNIKDNNFDTTVRQKPKKRQSEPAHVKKTPLKEKPSVKTPGRKGMTLRSRKL